MARSSDSGRTALILALGTALACSGGRPSPPATPPLEPVIAIVGATLWDGTDRGPIPNAVVLVRGDKIVCAGTAAACPHTTTRVIDAHEGWLIPGLIDTHVHLLFQRSGETDPGFTEDLRDLLARGITTVRDMGTNPAGLLTRLSAEPMAPRVYPMQLVAGFGFFYRREVVRSADGRAALRQPQATVMMGLGWTPMLYRSDDDPDSLVAAARAVGAAGLKLYADLDSTQVARLVQAAHRVGMPVWGHGWVQPASISEQSRAGQDGVVHAAGMIGELFTASERDTMRGGTSLLTATARVASPESAHDPRILAALDSLARRGTFFEPTLDVTQRSVAHFDGLHARRTTISEAYSRAAAGFGMEVTRQAIRRGVRITAGTDHVAYGPVGDRASLDAELALLVDSIGLTPRAALQAATRDAATALGGDAANRLGIIAIGRTADLVLLQHSPFADIRNLESVLWTMHEGRLLRPETLRSGIAIR
ncbi:MAG: amidohydrolase family protein [Gemmatimonadota bacterium]